MYKRVHSGAGLCINIVQFDDGTDSRAGLCIKRVVLMISTLGPGYVET